MSAQYRPYRDEESVDGLEATSWSDNEPGTIQIYEKTTEELPFNSANKRALWIQIALLITIGILGFLLGYFAPFHPTVVNVPFGSSSSDSDADALEHFESYFAHEDPTIKDKLLANIDGNNILSLLKAYNDTNRIPGSDSDHKFAQHVQESFQNFDFDRVTSTNYTFKTMLPNKASVVKLLSKDNRTLYSNVEHESYNHDDMRPFLPLSQANETVIVTNQLLYVNRGTKEDYAKLSSLGIGSNETEGKVLVIRQTFYQAHDVVITAQESGARAILLFPDPNVYGDLSPYPKSVRLPNDAGRSHPTAWSNYGDLASFNLSSLTGMDPAKLGLDKEYRVLNIPVIPISFNTAQRLLRGLSGVQAPNEWNCFDFTLYLGPIYKEENNEDQRDKIRIEFNNQETTVTSTTVTGIIVGSTEPDRYIVIGSRRDSLNRGLLDSVSGTAVMLEIARVYGVLLKQGWRPRRTIIFNSFGAESLNLIGSSNWLETHQRLLHSRAVAYLNCDLVVAGNHSAAIAASPLLYQVLFNSTKQVVNPNINEMPHQETVYDAWKELHHVTKKDEVDANTKLTDPELEKVLDDYEAVESKLPKGAVSGHSGEGSDDGFGAPGGILNEYRKSATVRTRPKVRKLDLESIYSPFFLYAGIPVVDVRYAGFVGGGNNNSTLLEDMMPLIGTKYDNLATIQHIDPHLKYHVAVAQILSEILRDLSDSIFLPFNLLDYAVTLKDSYSHFVAHYGKTFSQSNVELESLKYIVQDFSRTAIKFHHRQDMVNVKDAMKVRKFNDQLMLLERAFLDPNGVPNYWERKHIILSKFTLLFMLF